VLSNGYTSALFADEIIEDNVETVAPKLQTNFFKTRTSASLDEEKIEASPSLSQALDGTPGVGLQETSRGGGTLFIRGLIGPENLILIDGLRFNQSTFRTGPNQYLDTIGLSAITEVETLNGPAGLLFGSNAIGGLIHLKTESQLFRQNKAAATLGFNSGRSSVFGLFKTALATEKATLSLGLNYSREGELTAGEGPFLMAALQEDGRFLGSSFERLGWSLGLNSRPTKNLRLNARYLGSTISDAPRLDRIGAGRLRIANNEDHFGYLKAILAGPKFFDSATVAVMFHRTKESQKKIRCKKIAGHARDIAACASSDFREITRTQENRDRVTTLGLSTSLRSEFSSSLSLTSGLDIYRDEVASEAEETKNGVFKIKDGNFPDASYNTGGLFALISWEFYSNLDEVLELQGGVRADWVNANAKNVEGLGEVDYSHIAPVGSLNLSYLSEDLTSWLGWHQGFRPPNLAETIQLGDTGNFFEIPNDALSPERSNSFEIGAKYRLEKVGNLNGSLFLNLINNKITREASTFQGADVVDEKEVRRRVNEGDAYYYGWEASYSSRPIAHFSLNASASFIEGAVSSKNEDSDFDGGILHDLLATSDQNYQHARRLPPLSYKVGVEYKPSTFRIAFWIAGNGAQRNLSLDDRKDLRICEITPGQLNKNCQGSDGWATFNLSAATHFEKLDLGLGIENIFDERYRRHGSGVPGVGRTIFGHIKLSI